MYEQHTWELTYHFHAKERRNTTTKIADYNTVGGGVRRRECSMRNDRRELHSNIVRIWIAHCFHQGKGTWLKIENESVDNPCKLPEGCSVEPMEHLDRPF